MSFAKRKINAGTFPLAVLWQMLSCKKECKAFNAVPEQEMEKLD